MTEVEQANNTEVPQPKIESQEKEEIIENTNERETQHSDEPKPIEEEQQTEMKAFILKKTSSFKKIKKVCADEVDEEKIGKIPTILAKIAMDEIINESDEFNN